MKRILVLLFVFTSFVLCAIQTESYNYSDSWGEQGYNLLRSNSNGVEIDFSITEFSISQIRINEEQYQKINLMDDFLPNDAGAPDIPSISRFIAIPQNAEVSVKIIDYRREIIQNVNIIPSFVIPLDTDDNPLDHSKNDKIYNTNEFYPEKIVRISKITKIRGVDVAILAISPFQYNPVTQELVVFRDVKVEVEFSGGNGNFGEDRLRSRWWDPILHRDILNSASLTRIDYNENLQNRDGAEYLIICPDNATFIDWANTIKNFRQQQGISTLIVTTSEVGGNTVSAIETYVNNAYNNWSVVPAAILLLGDYGTGSNGIISQFFTHPSSYPDFVSDNHFADVDGDNLPSLTVGIIIFTVSPGSNLLLLFPIEIINYHIIDRQFSAFTVIENEEFQV